MEIGSIYEINPAQLGGVPTGEEGQFALTEVEKYRKKNVVFTSSGREAIALALRSIEKKNPAVSKRCLLPAYMCDTVFFPFERAGWEIHFYHIDRKMRANPDSLKELIGQVGPGLIFIHAYYGVDTCQPLRSFFQEWREKGIFIMEDMTQSYYLEPAGHEADYIVGSLRKWYAVPDGGFVASDEGLAEALAETGFDRNDIFLRERRSMLTEKWEYLYGAGREQEKQMLKEEYLRKNREMESWLDEYAGISALSGDSTDILANTDEKECMIKRQENCACLHERLKDRKQVVPVFDSMCAGFYKLIEIKNENKRNKICIAGGQRRSEGIRAAAPLYYPVYAVNRDELQRFLAQNGVYAPTLWPVGRENADVLTEEERYIYEHILALPMDQRYGTDQMRRVVEVIDRYESMKEATDRITEDGV